MEIKWQRNKIKNKNENGKVIQINEIRIDTNEELYINKWK